jgi:hypothetical protein
LKISEKKKEARRSFARKNKKCPECGGSVENGWHYVPALGVFTCTMRQNKLQSLQDILKKIK